MGETEVSKRKFVCIHCGERAPELYRQYLEGILKIEHCACCGQIVDRYIECDPVLIFLDALLHKPQTYRHMLHNIYIKWYWKLLVSLILCDAYIKWESHIQPPHLPTASDTIFYAALEWDFYIMLLYTVLEWMVLITTFYISSRVLLVPCKEIQSQSSRQKIFTIVKAVALSSFGKLFLIPAILWGQSQSNLWPQLTYVLVYSSNVCAFKAIHCSSRLMVMLTVGIAHLSPLLIGSP